MKSIYSRPVLQNSSICNTDKPTPPTLRIVQGEPAWNDAYKNWLGGKNPTDSPEWKAGVYLHFEPIEEETLPTPPPKPQASFFAFLTYRVISAILVLLLALIAYGYYRFFG
jgi:hypothetical protein